MTETLAGASPPRRASRKTLAREEERAAAGELVKARTHPEQVASIKIITAHHRSNDRPSHPRREAGEVLEARDVERLVADRGVEVGQPRWVASSAM